jgi:AbrB family looped-hinge helix DNA binding protein
MEYRSGDSVLIISLVKTPAEPIFGARYHSQHLPARLSERLRARNRARRLACQGALLADIGGPTVGSGDSRSDLQLSSTSAILIFLFSEIRILKVREFLYPHAGDSLMTIVKVRRAAQITLPRDIREAARLEEGDYLEAEVTEDGTILLKPVSIARRDPTPAQEAEILTAVDEARRFYAKKRSR